MAQFTEQLGVFTVTDREEGKKSIWSRVGVAFPTKNGAGLSIKLNALPVNGRLVILPAKDEDSSEPAVSE